MLTDRHDAVDRLSCRKPLVFEVSSEMDRSVQWYLPDSSMFAWR
jgi:hypothetical protein